MKLGKFPPELLERLRGKVEIKEDRVILGPKLREDAALLDYGDRVLVAKADPVTFANNQIGRYAVHVNANDMACCGATPRWYLATVLLPETCDEKDAEAIFDQILEAYASLGVSLVGGHSEVTRGFSHPIIAGCMLGEAEKGKIVTSGGAKDGDSIVLTKGIALEGTALLAYDASDSLQKAGVGPEVISAAKQLLFYPGISVIKDALMACSAVTVNSMHDPTEGGLATGLWEVSAAAGVGLAVEDGSIPILPECAELCRALGLDPLGLMASGALLITLPPENVPRLQSALEKEGVDAYEIGRITGPEEGVHIIRGHQLEPLPPFDRDELARFFGDEEQQPG